MLACVCAMLLCLFRLASSSSPPCLPQKRPKGERARRGGQRALSSNGCNFIGCNYFASKSDSNDGGGESGGKAVRLQSFSAFSGYALADWLTARRGRNEMEKKLFLIVKLYTHTHNCPWLVRSLSQFLFVLPSATMKKKLFSLARFHGFKTNKSKIFKNYIL